MGQEVTPEPDGVAVVVDVPADGVSDDYSDIVGIIVMAVIGIVYALVDGYKSGKLFDAVNRSLLIVRDGGLGDVIERRAAKLPADKLRFANAVLDVLDPYTTTSFTDLDDDLKAMLRDWLDGVVEPAGDGLGDAPLVYGTDAEAAG